MLYVANKMIALDADGYLINSSDWHPLVASALAAAAGISLQPVHWELMSFLQKFYQKYQIMPSRRALLKELADLPALQMQLTLLTTKLSASTALEITLNELFAGSFAKQASKLAGLPKPARCI